MKSQVAIREITRRATIRTIIKNGKMAGIGADHGSEILNNWAITTFKTLGINPVYVPVGDADAKAIIERFFGTVSTGFINTLQAQPKARDNHMRKPN